MYPPLLLHSLPRVSPVSSPRWPFDPFHDFKESAGQLCFITFFSCVVPFLSFLCIINNIYAIRFNLFKMVYQFKRIQPRRRSSIGPSQGGGGGREERGERGGGEGRGVGRRGGKEVGRFAVFVLLPFSRPCLSHFPITTHITHTHKHTHTHTH